MPQTQDSTSSSLLSRVRAHDADAWQRLSSVYGPDVYAWARAAGLQESDAADVVQEDFRAVEGHIDAFRHDDPGDSFRGWLSTIARNTICDHFRDQAKHTTAAGGTAAHRLMEQIADRIAESMSLDSTTQSLAARALRLIQTDFEEQTWRAFLRYGVDGLTAPEVAEELGMSPWAVYKAKSRVLNRLREEFGELRDF